MADFKRIWLPRIINYVLLCGSTFLFGTGLALAYRLPRGRGGRGLEMLGMTRQEWGDLHLYAGILMGLLVLVHLALHWSWVKRATLSITSGFGWLAILFATLCGVLPLVLPISR